MPTERSSLPARTDSGSMVELVMEAVADQLSPEIQRMEIALARAGDLIAAYAQEYYAEPRMLRIKGPGGSVSVKKFMNVDLEGSYSFQAEAGSGLPRTRAGQIQSIKEMVEMGILDPKEAAMYMPVAGLKGIQTRMVSDEDFANRKIDKLIKGMPLNIPAMQQAVMAVQQTGMDSRTGQFFSSPEEAMAFVQSASLQPFEFENLQVSANVIAEAMKTEEYEKYAPDAQARFQDHFSQLRGAMASATQDDNLRVTLGLDGTVGPTAAAAILNKKGITTVTPDTMMEEPLSTSVYDSVDKPDQDSTGNDMLTEFEQTNMIRQTESEAHLKDAQATAAMAQAQHAAEQGAASATAEERRKEERHQQEMSHKQAAHEAQMKASNVPAKP